MVESLGEDQAVVLLASDQHLVMDQLESSTSLVARVRCSAAIRRAISNWFL